MKAEITRRLLLTGALVLALGAARAVADDGSGGLFTDWYNMAQSARENKTDQVLTFIHRGDNPNFLDEAGRSPLDYAASFGNVVMAKMLLDAGARPDYRDKFGSTPLHWAAEGGQIPMIELLVAAKAPVDAANRQGITPLMLAANADKGAAVRALLKAGADPKKQDFTGRDALGYATGRPEALRALRASRAG